MLHNEQALPVLVTGGAGFIGSHTCKALAERGYEPVTFDNLSRGHADSVRWGPLVEGDILNPLDIDRAFTSFKPRAVIHFAALAYVGESTADPLSYYQANVSGLINVLKAMVAHNVGSIVFSSSCATYGIPEAVPIPESAPQRPISPYGWSKLMCEQVVLDASAAYGLSYAILRYFNACGADPGGDLAERHDPETHLIPLAIDAATGRRPPIQLFGSDYPTQDGTCERDYIHVSDLAEAHVKALQHLTTHSKSLILNIGTGQAYSLLKVLTAVEEVIGRPVPHVWAPRRAGDPPAVKADPSAAERILGFRAQYSDLTTIVRTAWRARAQFDGEATQHPSPT